MSSRIEISFEKSEGALSFAARRYCLTVLVALTMNGAFSGCALLQKKEEPDPISLQPFRSDPLTPEQTTEVMNEVGGNWLYGQGVGEAAMNLGAIVAFPPYAAVVAGNAALSLSGYKPLEVSRALPKEEGEGWSETFDLIASGPGRLVAAMAGKEYRTKEVAKARLKPMLERAPADPQGALKASLSEEVVPGEGLSKDFGKDTRTAEH